VFTYQRSHHYSRTAEPGYEPLDTSLWYPLDEPCLMGRRTTRILQAKQDKGRQQG
jgi:hypothetical protein